MYINNKSACGLWLHVDTLLKCFYYGWYLDCFFFWYAGARTRVSMWRRLCFTCSLAALPSAQLGGSRWKRQLRGREFNMIQLLNWAITYSGNTELSKASIIIYLYVSFIYFLFLYILHQPSVCQKHDLFVGHLVLQDVFTGIVLYFMQECIIYSLFNFMCKAVAIQMLKPM